MEKVKTKNEKMMRKKNPVRPCSAWLMLAETDRKGAIGNAIPSRQQFAFVSKSRARASVFDSVSSAFYRISSVAVLLLEALGVGSWRHGLVSSLWR
jgi:hypothetical protein